MINHTQSSRHVFHINDVELSQYLWELKERNKWQSKMELKILRIFIHRWHTRMRFIYDVHNGYYFSKFEALIKPKN